jgi:thiosulfate dehydrogenase
MHPLVPRLILASFTCVGVVATAACGSRVSSTSKRDAAARAPSGRGDTAASRAPGLVPFRVPSDTELQDSTFRVAVMRGRGIILSTGDSLPHNVGNALRCTNCHLDAGTRKGAMPLVGVFAKYPMYRARRGRVESIEDRINDCFERSMNGRPLDAGGRDMRDMVAYLAFLSRGVPVGSEVVGQSLPILAPLTGDRSRGAATFASTCSRCHGMDGNGSLVMGAPPLWGRRSFNDGAGMARVPVAASFIQHVMPYDRSGTLTAQQAFDVAAYIDSQPRPTFTKP